MKKGILTVMSLIGGVALGTGVTGKIWKDKVIERAKMSEKHLSPVSYDESMGKGKTGK